jgi:hypothetical protein
MFRSAVITLALCFATVTAQAALLGRAALTPGGTDYQAYYDDVLNITWLADANNAQTSGFDDDGSITWFEAGTWFSSLNANAYLGLTAWRLPKIINILGPCNSAAISCLNVSMIADEMVNLSYKTLGNVGYYTALGLDDYGFYDPNSAQPTTCGNELPSCLTNVGPFSNFQPSYYWYSNEYPTVPGEAWHFNFYNGIQSAAPQSNTAFVWAVHDGDPFSVVPVPAAVWLFGSALGLMGVMRRKIAA